MKRLTAILVAGLFVLAPLSASAMEMMSDSNMKDVTGQAGVSIAIDDVVIYQESIADTTYWDTDGTNKYDPTGNGDYTDQTNEADYFTEFGVQISYDKNTKRLIEVDAITDDTNYAPGFETFTDLDGNAYEPGIVAGDASALSIDVGIADTLSAGKTFNAGGTAVQVAGVVIGLPTVEITQYHTADRRSISLVQGAEGSDGSAVNSGQTFIDIQQSGTSKMVILGGTLEIAPH